MGFEDETQQFIRSQHLHAEVIHQVELVWESRLSPDVLGSASVYDQKTSGLIREGFDPATQYRQFQNLDQVAARGVELQLDLRRGDGIWSYASYSRQKTTQQGKAMLNSPRNMVKAGLSTPSSEKLQGALELQYESARKTLAGTDTDPALLANLTLSAALPLHARLSLTVKNLFDSSYAVPGGVDHVMNTIPQDGRTVLIRLRIGG